MKKAFISFFAVLMITACSKSKGKLYKETDSFVQSLQTTYESYGLNGAENSKITSDGLYQVTPIGRLINVKIMKEVNDKEYEKLKGDLADHYKGDKRVNKVYVCEAGTVMIDCRN